MLKVIYLKRLEKKENSLYFTLINDLHRLIKDGIEVTIESEDSLKIKLKSPAIRRINTERDNILIQDEKRAIKSLINNKEIVIQRPDKGGGVEILDRQYYPDRLLNLISDSDKFSTCSSDQSDNLKKEINIIAEQFRNSI